jgi:predicted peptidase
MVDDTVRDFRGDPKRVYLTGLSYGGFGSWYLAAQHPEKFAAVAPVVGYGHPAHAEPIAKAKLPVWCFSGGRDPVVAAEVLLRRVRGPREGGTHERPPDESRRPRHFTWTRVYGGNDLYDWMLGQSR